MLTFVAGSQSNGVAVQTCGLCSTYDDEHCVCSASTTQVSERATWKTFNCLQGRNESLIIGENVGISRAPVVN